MMADDGSYDSPSEGITGAIDVSGWSPGAYVVGVRAKDAAGHWGPVTRLSLSVTMEGPDDAGPKFLWLIATPNHTMGAKKITLKGKIDDSTTGGSRPVLVDFSLNGGSQPGMGTLVRLNGQGTGAHFSAKMDVTHLMEGITYTVFARSMDSRGNWGPVATTAFMVMSHPMGEH
jgi:hypothetical protein